MSPAEFHEYWRTSHAAKVAALPISRLIQRYVQAHTLEAEYVAGEPAFDGTAELWFENVADKETFYADAEYLTKVAPDERFFADTRTVFFLTNEETVIG